MRRPNAAEGLASVIAGLAVVVIAGPAGARHALTEHAAVTWPALRRGQWWRVPLSPLVQENARNAITVLPLVAGLPLVARRRGPARAIGWFFAIDAVCTVPVLAALSAIGSHAADDPNLGSSAGGLGLVTIWAFDLPDRRRDQVISALLAGVAAVAVSDPDIALAQHLAAIGCGALVARAHD